MRLVNRRNQQSCVLAVALAFACVQQINCAVATATAVSIDWAGTYNRVVQVAGPELALGGPDGNASF
jgi:hypothetical protein